MNKYVIGSLVVVTVGVILYFVFFAKKAATQTGTGGGGLSAPKPLGEADFLELEKTFANGNPFETEKVVKAAEISAVGEDDPAPHPDAAPGTVKIATPRSTFNAMVRTQILKLIRDRSPYMQQIEDERFLNYSGPARAGYNASLAQALAYTVRQDLATSRYIVANTNITNSNVTGDSTTGVTGNDPKSDKINGVLS